MALIQSILLRSFTSVLLLSTVWLCIASGSLIDVRYGMIQPKPLPTAAGNGSIYHVSSVVLAVLGVVWLWLAHEAALSWPCLKCTATAPEMLWAPRYVKMEV